MNAITYITVNFCYDHYHRWPMVCVSIFRFCFFSPNFLSLAFHSFRNELSLFFERFIELFWILIKQECATWSQRSHLNNWKYWWKQNPCPESISNWFICKSNSSSSSVFSPFLSRNRKGKKRDFVLIKWFFSSFLFGLGVYYEHIRRFGLSVVMVMLLSNSLSGSCPLTVHTLAKSLS